MNEDFQNGKERKVELYRQAILTDIAMLKHSLRENRMIYEVRSKPLKYIRNLFLASAAAGFLCGAYREHVRKTSRKKQLEELMEMLERAQSEETTCSCLGHKLQNLVETVFAVCKKKEPQQE